MNKIKVLFLFFSITLWSCGPSKGVQNADSQSYRSDFKEIAEQVEESEKSISKIDSLTAEIDRLMSELNDPNY